MRSKLLPSTLGLLVGLSSLPMNLSAASDPPASATADIVGMVKKGSARVENAVVSIVEVPGNYRPPTTPVLMDQLHKTFIPHVIAVMKGTTIRFHNSDPFYHNVFSSSRIRMFNVSQAGAGDYSDVLFSNIGVAPIRCHVHPNMRAYVVVLPNPFFCVTNAQGAFSIVGLPSGHYTLKVWSEQGTSTQEISVPSNGKLRVIVQL